MRRHVEFTLYIRCINNCWYCPQGKLNGAYNGARKMSKENFKKMLGNIPEDVEVHFSGFSEPFGHPEAHEFVRLAAEKHEVVVYTTTVGLDVDKLADIPFKEFKVHDISVTDQTAGTGQATMGPAPKFVPYKTVQEIVSNPISRAGNNWDMKEHEGAQCSKSATYEQNVVLPDGSLYLCCMDYGLTQPMGNLLTTNFNDIPRPGGYELCKKCEFFV